MITCEGVKTNKAPKPTQGRQIPNGDPPLVIWTNIAALHRESCFISCFHTNTYVSALPSLQTLTPRVTVVMFMFINGLFVWNLSWHLTDRKWHGAHFLLGLWHSFCHQPKIENTVSHAEKKHMEVLNLDLLWPRVSLETRYWHFILYYKCTIHGPKGFPQLNPVFNSCFVPNKKLSSLTKTVVSDCKYWEKEVSLVSR